jgi:hypothetical protein
MSDYWGVGVMSVISVSRIVRKSVTDAMAESASGQPISLLGHLEAQNAALRLTVAELASHNAALRERVRQAGDPSIYR